MVKINENSTGKYARVKINRIASPVLIPITAAEKPLISPEVVAKWQSILNLVSQVIGIPASLIMQVEEKEIRVFLSSDSPGNPYELDERAELGMGLYCETVVGRRSELLVPNALADPDWKQNPDVKLHMISYYGLPVLWPDGEVFGTFCVLDKKENTYTSAQRDMLKLFKVYIEDDLKVLLANAYLKNTNLENDMRIREIHHRIKNQFNMLLSLLYLKMADATQEKLDPVILIREIAAKIEAISLIHQKLYAVPQQLLVHLGTYLRELAEAIVSTFKLAVKITVQAPDLAIGDKLLLPCGLIINELVTNSIKYAFATHPEPCIEIKIKALGEGYFELCYFDNGPGLPPEFDFNREHSLGMQIIAALTQQLNGSFEVNPLPGCLFRFKLLLA